MDDHGRSPRLSVGSSGNGRLARRALFVAIGVLALCVAAPAFASARVEWKLNSVPVGESTAVEWNGKLNATDTETLLGHETVECSDKVEGTVGTGGAGEVTKVTTSGCTGIVEGEKCSNVGELALTIVALNLPWRTELVSSGGALHYVLVSGGKGTPGLEVHCKVAGIKTVDTCTGNLGATTSNGESGVTTALITTEKLSCSQAKKAETGSASGSGSIVAKGGTLSVANEEPPVWLEKGSPVTTGRLIEWNKGRLTLIDYTFGIFGTLGVTCEDSGQGTVAPGSVGTITKVTISKCERSGESECKGEYSLEAKNLPWHTELFSGSSGVDYSTANDGSGTPGFTLKCEVKGTRGVEDRCTGVAATHVTGTEGGGLGTKYLEERFRCSLDSGSGYYILNNSSQKLELVDAEALNVS